MIRHIDFSRESYPYWFYRRVAILNPVEFVLFELQYGFNYVVIKTLEKHDDTRAGVVNPPLNVDYLQTGRNGHFHYRPIGFDQFASPGYPGVTFVAEAAGVFGVNFTAQPLKVPKTLEYLYVFRDTIQLQISGQTVVSNVLPALNRPSYVDVVVTGRYYPEESVLGERGSK